MFIITADQRDSRNNDDLVPQAIARRPSASAAPACDVGPRPHGGRRAAARRRPIPTRRSRSPCTSRASAPGASASGSGPSRRRCRPACAPGAARRFVHARDAVERAKRAADPAGRHGRREAAADAEALVRLLVELRDRRSAEGWEVYDLLAEGLSQRAAAERLGITEGAVSLRAKAAGLRAEEAARARPRARAGPRRRRPLSTSAVHARLTAW